MKVIDFKKLNKRKTYIGLEYGTSLIAKQIIKFSKCYCPNSDKTPTHVFAVIYRLGSWWIYESHAKGDVDKGIPKGVRRYKASIWLDIEKDTQKNFKVFEQKVSRKMLEEYIGQPYGIGDIKSLLHAAIHHNNGKQKNKRGLICSEYISLCYPEISKYYNLPEYCITPAHFQDYFDTKKIEEL